MSKSKLTDLLSLLPPNVRVFPDAQVDLEALDKSRRALVIKAVTKIAQAPNDYGKPLENQEGRQLYGYRSAYVDNKRVRIIWRVVEDGKVEIMIIAAIGVRDKMLVYETAAKRREELEAWITEVIQTGMKK